jgi:hypothetical protein
MSCEPSERRITIEIPNAGVELAPYTVDFRRERGKFDYFKGSFNSDVGREIQDAVLKDGGSLASVETAYIKMEGERVYPMIFDPGKVNFQRDLTSIELIDMMVDMDNANSDIKTETTTGERVLKDLFEQYQEGVSDPILTDFRVNQRLDPKNKYFVDRVEITNSYVDEGQYSGIGFRNIGEGIGNLAEATIEGATAGVDMVSDIFGKDYAVDYDNVSCLEAFIDMSNRMGVNVWTKPKSPGSMEFELIIGKFDNLGQVHSASSHDSDAMKITDFNISTMEDPIESVLVRGRVVHDDGMINSPENIAEWLSPKASTQDYRAIGRAVREEVDGKTLVFDVEVPRDNLANLAESHMQKVLQHKETGDIEIFPRSGRESKTDYRNLSNGDVLHVEPPKDQYCKDESQIYENDFIIEGVENNITNGSWRINLDVVNMVPYEEVPDGELLLMDIDSEEYKDPSDVNLVN